MAEFNRSDLVNKILLVICIDNRISDGIFNIEDNQHITILKEYLIGHGFSEKESINFCNRVVEGRFPERQAYNKDGILVTFPTPKHKHAAIARGTHFEENPVPQFARSEPSKITKRAGSKEPADRMRAAGISKALPKSAIPNASDVAIDQLPQEPKKEPNIFQGNTKLAIEPIGGEDSENEVPSQGSSTSPPPHPAPKTPQQIEAEKELAKQIIDTDETVVTNVANVLNINESLEKQLTELYKHADKMGYREAVTFLTKYVKP